MDCLQSSIERVDILEASLSAHPLSAELGLIDTLHATLSYVCNINPALPYLRVTPSVVWLSAKGSTGQFKVESNADWQIK